MGAPAQESASKMEPLTGMLAKEEGPKEEPAKAEPAPEEPKTQNDEMPSKEQAPKEEPTKSEPVLEETTKQNDGCQHYQSWRTSLRPGWLHFLRVTYTVRYE